MKGKEVKFKTRDADSDLNNEETIGLPEGKTPEEFINQLLKDYNDEEDKRHLNNPNYKVVYRKLISIDGYSGKDKEVVAFCKFNHKVNQFTITRDGKAYDIIQCVNCKFLYRRENIETPEFIRCYPDRLCLECNKIFMSPGGLNLHNERGRHKTPDWFPDGV